MRNRKVLWIFLGVILLLPILISYKTNYTNYSKLISVSQTATPTISPLPNVMTDVSQEELQQYYDTYKKPHVTFVRSALDAYLAHDSSKACILKIAVTSRTDMGVITGLDSFSKDYYESKFVVLTVDGSKLVENSIDIQIMFQDKPDRIFYALVGADPSHKSSNEFCLLGFNSKENVDQETLQNAIEFYKPLLFDQEHAL
jgi:hypothetical protein